MSGFAPKIYQQQVLDSVEAYFKACHELPSPSIAFTATTERLWGRGLPYNPLAGFPTDMPYFCLRVPTGGGRDLAGGEKRGARQHASAALRAQRDFVAGAQQADS